jgi:hypothetical protein
MIVIAAGSGATVHSQRLHEQAEMTPVVGKSFLRIIRTHITKLTKVCGLIH